MQPRRGIVYDFPLNNGRLAQLVLPYDLTKAEADRLCAMIQTLPIPDVGEQKDITT